MKKIILGLICGYGTLTIAMDLNSNTLSVSSQNQDTGQSQAILEMLELKNSILEEYNKFRQRDILNPDTKNFSRVFINLSLIVDYDIQNGFDRIFNAYSLERELKNKIIGKYNYLREELDKKNIKNVDEAYEGWTACLNSFFMFLEELK